MIRLVCDFDDWMSRKGCDNPLKTRAYCLAVQAYSERLLSPTERVRLAQCLLNDINELVAEHGVTACPLDHDHDSLIDTVERMGQLLSRSHPPELGGDGMTL